MKTLLPGLRMSPSILSCWIPAFAGMALFLHASLGNAADATPVRSLTVSGEAVANTPPDQAVLPFTVQTEHKDLKTAKQLNDEKIKKLLALAKKYGVDPADMRTNYTNIQPQYDYVQNSKPKLRGYQALASLQFKLSPLEKVAGFMDEAVAAGIDRVDGIQYTLKDDQKLREETMLKALTHASEKAKRMASTLSMELGKPLQINESSTVNYPQPPMPMMMARAAMADGAEMKSAPDLPAGTIEIRQNVTVNYEIK